MLINRNNYEEFFLMYVDGELSAGDRIAVEKFASANPDLQEELNLLKETVLVADNEIVYEHKEELYKEEEKKVIGFAWWRMAAAVILLFGAGTWGWIYLNKEEMPRPPIATITPANKEELPAPAAKTIIEQDDEDATPAISVAPAAQHPLNKADKPISQVQVVEKTTTVVKEEIKLDLPTDLTTTSIEPPKENIAIVVTPQKLQEENITEQLMQKENKTPSYEYVDPVDDDMIYVANTSVSKRNKFRGVIRKATRILDRVTSTQ